MKYSKLCLIFLFTAFCSKPGGGNSAQDESLKIALSKSDSGSGLFSIVSALYRPSCKYIFIGAVMMLAGEMSCYVFEEMRGFLCTPSIRKMAGKRCVNMPHLIAQVNFFCGFSLCMYGVMSLFFLMFFGSHQDNLDQAI